MAVRLKEEVSQPVKIILASLSSSTCEDQEVRHLGKFSQGLFPTFCSISSHLFSLQFSQPETFCLCQLKLSWLSRSQSWRSLPFDHVMVPSKLD